MSSIDRFHSLSQEEQVRRIDVALSWPNALQGIFDVGSQKRMKQVYRNLLKKIHPDVVDGNDVAATSAVAKLTELYETVQKPLTVAQFDLDGTVYRNGILIGKGDIADVYHIPENDDHGFRVVKMVREPGDRDLLANERAALKRLALAPGFDKVVAYYPQVVIHNDDISVFVHDTGTDMNPMNWYTLDQLRAYFGAIDVRHIAWIWRRLLVAMSFAHRNGIIHGAITPANILIDPVHHGLMLIGWVHASIDQSVIRSISQPFRNAYPDEVLKKQKPTPAIDIHMAAYSMCYAADGAKGFPDAFHRYFNWCMSSNPAARPQKFDTLLDTFDKIIYDDLRWKKEFVLMDILEWSWLTR